MNIKIRLGFSDIVLFEGEYESTKAAVEHAVSKGANLKGAYLEGANLEGAYLEGAYLEGVYLEGAYLEGERSVLCLGPIGTRCAYLTAYLTDKGVMVKDGCFFGTLDEFSKKVTLTHAGNDHGKEYAAAIALISVHAEIWGKK